MRESLSRERVLGAAVALVDGHGIGALTMRRLAADLDVEAMSLYYYLPGKEGLLDGVVDKIQAEITAAIDDIDAPRSHAHQTGAGPAKRPRAGTVDRNPRVAVSHDDWRNRLRRWFLAARAVMLRHPWAPELISTRRRVPDGLYAYYERILATLIEAGFSYRVAHRALHAFGTMPLGFIQELFAPAAGSERDEPAEIDLSAMATGIPHLTAMMAAELHDVADPTLGWCDSQTEFEFTLDLILNGLERMRNT